MQWLEKVDWFRTDGERGGADGVCWWGGILAVVMMVYPVGVVAGQNEPSARETFANAAGKVSAISLEDAIAAARRKAPEVIEAKGRLKRGWARRQRADVFLPYNPSLEAEIERFEFGGFSYGEVRVGVVQRFPVVRERHAERRAADAFNKLLELRLRRARWRAEVRVRETYFLSRIGVRRYRFALRVRAFSKRLLSAANQRFEAGQISKVEVATARSQYAEARQRVVDARTKLTQRLESLAELTGNSEGPLPWASESLPALRDLSASRVSTLQTSASESAPSVDIREAQIQRASRQLETAKLRAWPDPKVGVFFKNRSPESGASVNGLVGGLSIPLPLWERNQGDRADAKAERAVAQSDLASLRRRLSADIEQRVAELRSAKERISIFRTTTKPALTTRLSLLEKGYQAGEFDITDVVVAEQRLIQQQIDTLQALRQYIRAMASLERLTGANLWTSTRESSQ